MDRIVYERMAAHDTTHWWYRARREILSDYLTRFGGLPKDARILEIGCGTGHNLPMLASFGEVDAIEIDETAGKFAAERLGKPIGTSPLPELKGVDRIVPVGRVAVVPVARLAAVVVVAPEQQLLQHEEPEDAREEEGGDALGRLRLLEQVRQQVQEHHAQQRAHRVAHEGRNPARAGAQRHDRRDGERQQAARDARGQDRAEDGHRAHSRQMNAPMRPLRGARR